MAQGPGWEPQPQETLSLRAREGMVILDAQCLFPTLTNKAVRTDTTPD